VPGRSGWQYGCRVPPPRRRDAARNERPAAGSAVAPAATPPAFARAPVLAFAGLVAAVLLALAGRYGPHRDELYFAAAGRHLAWGYPDQPPLTPLLARIADSIAPGSLIALRTPSALAAAAVVVLAALAARELGGARPAQILAAAVTATSGVILITGHLLSTTTNDILIWATITYLALRALVRDQPRLWLVVGAVAGVGLENKHLVAFLLAGLAVGVALSPAARHHATSPWAWAGAAIAVALWLPNLIWQASHGWPQITLAGDVRGEYGVVGERLAYVLLQIVLISPLAAPLWVAGLVALFRRPGLAATRPIAWAYVVLLLTFLVVGGKGYYLAGLYPVLVAAGLVMLAERWAGRPRLLAAAGAALAIAGLLVLPAGLPVLPERTFVSSIWSGIGEEQRETIGWPEFVDAVSAARAQIPPASRARAIVLTGNYGEAGAVEWYGKDIGLPPVYSGHNGFGLWGPPPDGSGPVLVAGYGRTAPPGLSGCRVAARVENRAGADNEERGGEILICQGPSVSWRTLWPSIVHLSA